MSTAPQTSIPPAANVLGLIGTVCWAVQLCPQIWHSWRTKDTAGLPSTMMFLWSLSGVPFGVYAVVQRLNVPLQVQPQFFCLLCMVSWGQVMVYSNKWPTWKAVTVCSVLLALYAGLQVLFILVIRGPYYERNVSWPVQTMGILAFITLISGYLPIPFELVKRRGRVVGISLLFLTVDWFGAFFSLMSLVAQNSFDVLFGTLYAMCATIELSMFISHFVWYLRTKGIRRRAKEQETAYDDFSEAIEWQEKGFDVLGMIVKKGRKKAMAAAATPEEGRGDGGRHSGGS